MSVVAQPEPGGREVAPRRDAREIFVESPGFTGLKTAGDIGSLFLKVLTTVARPPFTWVTAAMEETNALVRRCAVPLGISMFAWTIGFAFILLGGFVELIGAEDRMPGALLLGFTREPIVWVTGMVFAGATGAAICADVAARKNREELDALAVLGIDQIRLLVVPKVVASVIACMVLGTFAIFVTFITTWGLGPLYTNLSANLVYEGIVSSMLSTDQIAALLKFMLIGLLVGVVSCAKGLGASGGTEGVGKAVNQTIVLTFAGVWVINSVFNLAYLTIFPQLADFKG